LLAKIPEKALSHAQRSLGDGDGGCDMWYIFSFDACICRGYDGFLNLVTDANVLIIEFEDFAVFSL
jgi:hypothetical protein